MRRTVCPLLLLWQPVPRFLPLRTGDFEEAACWEGDMRDKEYIMGEWRERIRGRGEESRGRGEFD